MDYETSMELVDFENVFQTDPEARVLTCEEDLMDNASFKDFMLNVFSDESQMSFSASCPCGHTKGNFHKGLVCERCKGMCESPTFSDIRYKLWIQFPEFTTPVLHPIVYDILNSWLGAIGGKHRMIDWLMGYVPDTEPKHRPSWYEPGWQSFHDNFDKLCEYFLTSYPPLQQKSNRSRAEDIPEFLTKYRHLMFTYHVPILDSTLHLVTHSGDMQRLDAPSKVLVQLAENLSVFQYEYKFTNKNKGYLNKTMNEIYRTYLEYYNTVFNVKIYGAKDFKNGFIRGDLMGYRSFFSFRGVITPISGEHDADELHVPWKFGLECLRLQIINILINRKGMTLTGAFNRLFRAEADWDADVNDAMEILIAECPYKGLPCTFNRNPTIVHGSTQTLFITRFIYGSDAIGFGPKNVTRANADYDGDEMNGMFILEMGAVPKFMNMHPKTTMYSLQEMGIGEGVALSDQMEIAMQGWLDKRRS